MRPNQEFINLLRYNNLTMTVTASLAMWYDFNLATASTYQTGMNTVIAGDRGYPDFSRVYDLSNNGVHLHRTTNPADTPDGTIAEGRYFEEGGSYFGRSYEYTQTPFVFPFVAGTVSSQPLPHETIFLVAKRKWTTSEALPNILLFNNIYSIAGTRYSNQVVWTSSGANAYTFNVATDVGSASRTPYNIGSNPDLMLIVATFTPGSRTYLKINGTASTSSDSSPTTTYGSGLPADAIYCASGFINTINYNQIGEVLVYSGILSTTDISTVETYLKAKWNISY